MLLLFDDPLTLVELSVGGSTVAGGAGAILTSFDLGPRGFTALLLLLLLLLLMMLLLGGEVTNWLLLMGGMDMVVLLVGDALIVMVFVLITALVELAAWEGSGDDDSEERSSSIMASWIARSSCEFSFRPRENPAGRYRTMSRDCCWREALQLDSADGARCGFEAAAAGAG